MTRQGIFFGNRICERLAEDLVFMTPGGITLNHLWLWACSNIAGAYSKNEAGNVAMLECDAHSS